MLKKKYMIERFFFVIPHAPLEKSLYLARNARGYNARMESITSKKKQVDGINSRSKKKKKRLESFEDYL